MLRRRPRTSIVLAPRTAWTPADRDALVAQSVADIATRTGWREFLAWFTTQATLHDLPPRPLTLQWTETARAGVLRRKRTRTITEPSPHITGWIVQTHAHPLNETDTGTIPADTYFVAPTGAIHPIHPDGTAALPLTTLPPTDRTTWTVPRRHGPTLAENLEHVMTQTLIDAIDPSTV